MLFCSEEALADTLDAYKDDPVVKDTIGDKSGGEVDTMTASMKSSGDCSGTSEAAVQSCADVPANAAVNSIADSTNSTEKDTINSKMVEISQHFQQRLRYYQLKEYERLGIEPPAVLLDETNIGFPGIMKIGYGGSLCFVGGLGAGVGYAFDLKRGDLGVYAGVGVIAGACVEGSFDAVFSWVFTEDNIQDAGGFALGGELEVKIGGGVGIGVAVDLEPVSPDGAPFPSIEISASVSIGAGFSASLTVGYEIAGCLTDDTTCSADESNEILELPNPNLVEI